MSETEQRFHDLEQRYLALKKEYDISTIERDSAKNKSDTLQTSLDEVNARVMLLDREINNGKVFVAQKENAMEELQRIEVDQREKLRHAGDESDRLKDEVRAQAAEMLAAQKELREVQYKLSTAENAQLPVQFELTRTLREKDGLVEQVKWLEQDLAAKSVEWVNQRIALSSKCNDLESQLTTEKADNASKTQLIISLQSRIATQDQKVDNLMGSVTELEHNLTVQRNSYSSELDSQKKAGGSV